MRTHIPQCLLPIADEPIILKASVTTRKPCLGGQCPGKEHLQRRHFPAKAREQVAHLALGCPIAVTDGASRVPDAEMPRHAQKGLKMKRLDRRTFGAMSAAFAAVPVIGRAAQSTPSASPAATPAMDIQIEGTIAPDGSYLSDDPLVPNAYTKPLTPEKMYDSAPGNGGPVSVLIMSYNPPPNDKANNPWWQELETRLNVQWDALITPQASYGERATTLIASGDMPDLFYINAGQTQAPLLRYVTEGAFLDLTEYLTPDELQNYPSLAKYLDIHWEAATLDGKIYGVPNPQRKAPQLPFYRNDWSKQVIGGVPTNATEVHDMLVGMSTKDPDGNVNNDTWGIAMYDTYWSIGLIDRMFNVPNIWKVDNGSFVRDFETQEWRDYLEYVRVLWEDGAYHPDATGMGFSDALSMFTSGRGGTFTDGWKIFGPDGYLAMIHKYQPDATADYLLPPGVDGGQGVAYNGTGTFGVAAIPVTVTDPDRVRELLRIVDYLSAPYGTEEYMFLQYGIEGVHYEINDNGFPVTNDRRMADWGQLTSYIGGPLPVHIDPVTPLLGPYMADLDRKALEIGIDDPAANLFSPTAISDTSGTDQGLTDARNDFVLGRGSMADIDAAIEAWKNANGEQIRRELEDAWAANQ